MIGRTLAHYEILDALGRGGMGEVFRARDTKLARNVAIKILPEIVANDRERRGRFEREAKLLASLNHPNIAQIYGLEEAGGVPFLVMELVEGLDLQKRIKDKGALDADEAVALAVQIAAGLEAAHEQGIVHRDLKPANVMVTGNGQVKILDFGLARAFAVDVTQQDPSLSPTITAALTEAGAVLGTAAYMSPEQARGKTVDRRADIWAFGVILWEMLTGARLFRGETVSDTLAGVLKEAIDFDAVGSGVPAHARYVLERCLDRDPSRRLRDIGEARLVLSGETSVPSLPASSAGFSSPPRTPVREVVAWILAGVGVAIAAFALLRGPGSEGGESGGRSIRAMIELPQNLQLSSGSSAALAISDDGRTIVVAAEDRDDGGQLFLFRRALDGSTFERIEGSAEGGNPTIAPDGAHVLFHTSSFRQYRIPISGGSATELGRGYTFGAVWTAEDSLYFCESYAGGLMARAAEGGTSRPFTQLDPQQDFLGHWHPDEVPGTSWILYTAYASPGDSSKVFAIDRRTRERRLVVNGARYGQWSESGHVLFVRGNQLIAMPVDRKTMRPRGRAATILTDVSMNSTNGFSQFALSREGTFVYMSADEASYRNRISMIRHDGTFEILDAAENTYMTPRLSPDGRLLAVTRGDPNRDIWVLELQRRAWTRVTFDPVSEFGPVWAPDGRWIYYARESPAFGVYRIQPFGATAPEPLLLDPIDHMPLQVFADGRFLVIAGNVATGHDLVLVDADGGRRDIRATAVLDTEGRVSPDGAWLAFSTDETGRMQVYAQLFPDGGTRVPISIDGGQEPCWSPRGDAIYYHDDDGLVRVAVEVVDGKLNAGKPEKLWTAAFERNWYTTNYDVLADDSGIVAIIPDTDRGRRRITLITDFFSELDRRAPATE